jgi:predicted CoA-binding protein
MSEIEAFLAQKRFAFVGVSRRPNDFSRTVFREFRGKGFDPVPVHPQATEVDGQRCYARVQDIQPPVDRAFLMTPPAVTSAMVRECAATGIKHVWMHRGAGPGKGSVSQEAVDFCRSQGIGVIPGECPMMFLPGAAWFHRFHGWLKGTGGRSLTAGSRTS